VPDPLHRFLAASGWDRADRTPLAGDASARRYLRLHRFSGEETAILMLTPPAAAAETTRFVSIARHLAAAGLSAPRVLASDAPAGTVLLEDLGDGLLAHLSDSAPATEEALYLAAVETLAALQAVPLPVGLAAPEAGELAQMIAPLAEWYLPDRTPGTTAELAALLRPALETVLETRPRVLVHRDFHAENLLWLPERRGAARIGLLDFQDAFAGPPAYDLVSLLSDARRDIDADVRMACLARFAAITDLRSDVLETHCAVLGAQRNLRILGIFARLSREHGKPRYVDLIPRVWRNLLADLSHPSLADLRAAVDRLVPPPGADHLSQLRVRWQTAQTP
jgi:aminoglycoside/choline kinase family phosphotransferase